MAVIGPHIKVSYRYTFLGQQCQNVQYYTIGGAAFATADMIQVLEALWDNQQEVLRELTPANLTLASWDSLLGEEIGGLGGYAEYAIPDAERIGLRAGTTDSDLLPPFNAFAFRQSVGTRATRPGQKRFPFVTEEDMSVGVLNATGLGIITPVAEAFSTQRVLGVPVATGVLTPVVGGTVVDGVPTVWQDVTGFVVNAYVSSQISRKVGRGA